MKRSTGFLRPMNRRKDAKVSRRSVCIGMKKRDKNVYYRDQPHVYRVEKTDRGMNTPLLAITEIRPGAETAMEPGALERFALRMAMYRMNGVVG